MKKKNVELLSGEIITMLQMEELEECPEVKNVECLGSSGYKSSCYWYSVEFTNGDSIDVYMVIDAKEA